MKYALSRLREYWGEVHHTMLHVATIADQNKMDVFDFFQQLNVWEVRELAKIDSIKNRK